MEFDTDLTTSKRRWLVTGAGGFIGSNLCEALIEAGQEVVGFDNFLTGHRANVEDVKRVDPENRYTFIEGDITSPDDCGKACEGVDIVLHQAALGSVPRSVANPIPSDHINVGGFVTMVVAAKDAGVKRMVYASSSSVYGDITDEFKREDRVGKLLSPYAATKKANELYAEVFSPLYGIQMVGLRYFNVFGPRQDPNGVYSAVIPRWIASLLRGEPCTIYGDGLTSRDFCYVKNVVQANIGAALGTKIEGGEVFNVACGATTNLLELHEMLKEFLSPWNQHIETLEPAFEPFRKGDIRASLANIDKAKDFLGYGACYSVREGLKETVGWYADRLLPRKQGG